MARIRLRIVGYHLPGRRFACYNAVHVGIQRRADVVSIVPGDAAEAIFDLDAEAVPIEGGAFDYRGPYVHGKRGERFLYLSWGEQTEGSEFTMFRRAKLQLSGIDASDVEAAIRTGATIEGRINLTNAKGAPLCASVRPPMIAWRVSVAAGA